MTRRFQARRTEITTTTDYSEQCSEEKRNFSALLGRTHTTCNAHTSLTFQHIHHRSHSFTTWVQFILDRLDRHRQGVSLAVPGSFQHGVQTWDHHAIKNIYVSICLLNRSVLSVSIRVCKLRCVCLCVCRSESWRETKRRGGERETDREKDRV